jgi:hypothetical protein
VERISHIDGSSMLNVVRLSLLAVRGVELRPHEAVAIVQELIHSSAEVELVPPFGPLSLESVVILPDGRVGSRSCAATPAVSEVGRLLEAMLPHGRGQGGLRYTLARAQLEVDAPPFDSLEALSVSLARFEAGDRRRVIRALLARAEGFEPRLVAVAPPRPPANRPAFAWRAGAAVVTSFVLGRYRRQPSSCPRARRRRRRAMPSRARRRCTRRRFPGTAARFSSIRVARTRRAAR